MQGSVFVFPPEILYIHTVCFSRHIIFQDQRSTHGEKSKNTNTNTQVKASTMYYDGFTVYILDSGGHRDENMKKASE